MSPANERWRFIVTLSPLGWVHTQNDPCLSYTFHIYVFAASLLVILLLYIYRMLLIFKSYLHISFASVLFLVLFGLKAWGIVIVLAESSVSFSLLDVGGGWGLSKASVATFNHMGGSFNLLKDMYHYQGCLNNPIFSNLGLCAASLGTFHVSSRIVANISESSLLLF